ncbi:MAG: hypothetical protein LBC72_00975, partial [Spirochaetaceae bacterium]|nr:hypothetical protein [Spirochaetaceae bacterium]
MTYREEQKERASVLCGELFNDPGGGVFYIKDKQTGKIKELTLPFVLKNRKLNLWEGIRDEAIAYFKTYTIAWHEDANSDPQEGPEGHLLSSNVACVNHLFPLRQRRDWAAAVLKNIDSRI